MALQGEAKTEEMKNFLVGFEFIYRNLVSTLEAEGVKEISPKVGDEFNPDCMQAIEAVYDEKLNLTKSLELTLKVICSMID
jgi:molecular chaperone GrpE